MPNASSSSMNVTLLQVTCNKFALRSRKGVMQYSYCYEGTFVTRAGALFVVPPAARRRNAKLPAPGRSIENFMLQMLYDLHLDPQGLTGRRYSLRFRVTNLNEAQSSQDRKALYHKYDSTSTQMPGTRSSPAATGASSHRYDCLLLLGAGIHSEATRRVSGIHYERPQRFVYVNWKTGGGSAIPITILKVCNAAVVFVVVVVVAVIVFAIMALVVGCALAKGNALELLSQRFRFGETRTPLTAEGNSFYQLASMNRFTRFLKAWSRAPCMHVTWRCPHRARAKETLAFESPTSCRTRLRCILR